MSCGGGLASGKSSTLRRLTKLSAPEIWRQPGKLASYGPRPTPVTTSAQSVVWFVYVELGEDEKALTAAQEALKRGLGSSSVLQPGPSRTGFSTAWMRRRPRPRRRAPSISTRLALQLALYVVDFLQHNAAGMQRHAAKLMGTPRLRRIKILYSESYTAAYGGEFAKARELMRRAVDSAQRADEKEQAAGYQAYAAVREALVGNMALAKQEAQAALALANGRDVEADSAITLALTGEFAQAATSGRRSWQALPQGHIGAVHIRANDSCGHRASKR